MHNIWRHAFFYSLILLLTLPHHVYGSSSYEDRKSGNYQSALKKFEAKAMDGDVYSIYMLGRMYREGQGVEKNYQQAVYWFVKAADKADLSSEYSLGIIYEKGGYGVERDYAKAVKWFQKVATKRHLAEQSSIKIYAMRRLGIYHETGTGVKQDYKQAVKWFTYAAQQGDAKSQARLGALYMQGFGVNRNPAAAYKWIEMSADGLAENIKKTIPDKLKELNVKGFLAARASWRDKFPDHIKPFGIVLGKRFPAELSYDLKDTFYKSSNPLLNTYAGVKPQQRFPGKADYKKVTVSTSKSSDKVYKISARIEFDSQSQCRKALSAYFQNGPGSGAVPVVVTNWSGVSDYTSQFDQSQLFVADFNVGFRPSNPDHPLKLANADNLTGVRLILSCQEGDGKIIFVHFPSVEKRIAESIEATDWWNDFYDSPESPSNRPEYMDLFGIALAQPLPNAQRQSDSFDGIYRRWFTISPPRPHKLFSEYTVYTSHLTNSVISIRAEGRFDSKDKCNRIIVVAAKELVMKYSTNDSVIKTLKDIEPTDIPWNLSNLTLTPDDTYFAIFKSAEKTSIYTQKDGELVPDSAKAKHLVNVSSGCKSSSDGKYWQGIVEYDHPLSDLIALKEREALDL